MSTEGEISGAKPRSFQLSREQQERHGDDWYIEPYWCIEALLAAEEFRGVILDPACGSGRIVDTCRSRGYDAVGSDLVDRCGRFPVSDFFQLLGPVDNIISNPPYRQGAAFARHALQIAQGKVALLVQAKFLYSQGRYELFTGTPVARIYHLSARASMPPGDLLLAGEIKAQGGKMDFCWVVWDLAHRGPPTAHWLMRGTSEAEYLEACRSTRERQERAA